MSLVAGPATPREFQLETQLSVAETTIDALTLQVRNLEAKANRVDELERQLTAHQNTIRLGIEERERLETKVTQLRLRQDIAGSAIETASKALRAP